MLPRCAGYRLESTAATSHAQALQVETRPPVTMFPLKYSLQRLRFTAQNEKVGGEYRRGLHDVRIHSMLSFPYYYHIHTITR